HPPCIHGKGGTAKKHPTPSQPCPTGPFTQLVNSVTFGSHGVTIRPWANDVTATWMINLGGNHDEQQQARADSFCQKIVRCRHRNRARSDGGANRIRASAS